jgi:hypothetical protein
LMTRCCRIFVWNCFNPPQKISMPTSVLLAFTERR